jgi:hypothetical protein
VRVLPSSFLVGSPCCARALNCCHVTVNLLTHEPCRNHGSQFEKHKTAFEEGGGMNDAYMEDIDSQSVHGSGSVDEKAVDGPTVRELV